MPDLQRMDAYADVPMEIEVELDRRNMSLKELLGLSDGSIVRLTRSAGENIDVRINGTRVGFGEIVIIEDKIGVRITDFDLE